MKILMVHPHDLWYDPWTVRILQFARELGKRGHSVKLCHLPRKEKPDHDPIRQTSGEDPPIYELKPRQVHLSHNFKLLYRLAKDCDILHLQKCFAAAALPLLWIARCLKKPIHYDWDDDETAIAKKVEVRRLLRFQLAVYEQYLPHFASTLTYSSQAIRQRAVESGFPEQCMWHLPVGADTERFIPGVGRGEDLLEFGLNPEKLTILYIGQMEGAAFADQLFEAAPIVLEKFPDTQFLFAGGGEQLESLRKQAECSEVGHALSIPGYVHSDRIPAIIDMADICVACFDESKATQSKSPLKIAEYMASGKPIVATRIGEVPWMLKDCGVTVEPGSSQALAQGILIYASDPEKRKIDSIHARQRALDLFTWGKNTDILLTAYNYCFHAEFMQATS